MINYIAVPYKSFKNRLAIIKNLEREMEKGDAKEWINIKVDDTTDSVICEYNDFRIEEDKPYQLIQMDKYNNIT